MNTATSAWTRKATSNEGGDFELPPGGTYPACLVGLIDLGTHPESFNNEHKDVHKILLVFELLAENDSKGQSFKVAREFTFSLNTKAKLRAFLEGWSGRKFADDEAVDLLSYVNMNGVVNITEGTSGNGRKYVDVASVTKPMRGLTVPNRSVEPVVWTFDGWNSNDEPPIPPWVPMVYGKAAAEKIKASREWAQLVPF
jgi:hypothetical protein